MFLALLFPLLATYAVWFIFVKGHPPKTAGVYSTPGKWFFFKYYIFYALFKLRQMRKVSKHGQNQGGFGVKSKSNENDMESGQELPSAHPKAVDAVYINGYSPEGYYLVAATARRHQNVVQTFCGIRIPGIGVLELPTAPETNLQADKKVNSYAAGGLEIKCTEPMKTWKITYSGSMKLNRKGSYPVELDLEWTATGPYFDFDTDTSAECLSRAVAREPWTREFFNKLKAAHQTHYEQFGSIKGTLKLDDRKHTIKLNGMRDHSYGNVRDWGDIHRYAFNTFALEDGTVGNVALVSMPEATMSHMEFGFVQTPDGRKLSVERIDQALYQLGEQQPPPSTFKIGFRAGGEIYELNVEVLERISFYMGTQWEGKVFENFSRVTLNGVKGTGIAEWNYRHIGGRHKA